MRTLLITQTGAANPFDRFDAPSSSAQATNPFDRFDAPASSAPQRITSIADIRAQYPQYNDMSDQQLGDALHQKFYADMPRDQFNQKIGLAPQPAPIDPT